MNKKLLTIVVGLILAVVLVSCNLSNLFKGKEEVQPPAQEEQQTQPPAKEQQPPQVPVTPPPPQKPKETKPKPPAETQKPAEETKPKEETKPAEEKKVPEAGLGVIFVTNVRTGVFRVKVDDEKQIDHSFSGKQSGRADEQRLERELKFPPGEHKFKFVCEDNQGSKGVKEMTMVFKPGEHKVVKVVVKGAPGDIKLELLE